MELTIGRSHTQASGGAVLQVAVPVTKGRVTLSRMRGAGPPARVVTGLRSASWVGPDGALAPDLGRLCHHASASVDARNRLRLDRHARAYLGVADPERFDVVFLLLADGGALIVPVEDLEARLERIGLP